MHLHALAVGSFTFDIIMYNNTLSERRIRTMYMHAAQTLERDEYYNIPYSAYISRVFNFANFASLESFAKLIQRIF